MKVNRKNDVFANIAASGMSLTNKGLVEPNPPILEEKCFQQLEDPNEGEFIPLKKINSAEELVEELDKLRKSHAPFLEQHAPLLPSYRIRQELKEFAWRIGTDEDEANFIHVLEGQGNWQKVVIPHYGAPLGTATTFYRTVFEVTEEMLQLDQVYMCFKGVDYKAHVFVNGNFLGSHEGFFAPFEMNCTRSVKKGNNTLLVKVENDYPCGSDLGPGGDKIYAATGIGYDDPEIGWHHCPPGMGIYQGVALEARASLHLGDSFVRPLQDLEHAEAWIELNNDFQEAKEIKLRLSVYGRNFLEAVFEKLVYTPSTTLETGLGDSFTESKLKAAGMLHATVPTLTERGRNRFIVPFHIPNARKWELDTPWLYQLHVELLVDGRVIDTKSRHFGMRSFAMDITNSPKGALYLNGRQIRLRGANTMGHEQQCVAKEDWDQLRDDILLAKLCNMNFLRITQRPVQPEVYDYCDMLGIMTQTDLPLFGVISRSQFCEGIRQAEEMERLIRSHPCNIMISYINEPFPNAKNKPHRHLIKQELLEFFKAADIAVKLNNPDRVIKHVDGDYDPPNESLTDNHCYPCWYNGHGIDIGKLHKGYWLAVKPDWYYGCGEFGSEGLDPIEVMRKYYPVNWLPQSQEEEQTWSPSSIIDAQTGRFHYFFYDTQETLEDWVEASHRHQAWATRIMTEAFRRNSMMTTFAIHLFIDAFPSGWMKTIMDVERRPKPAYFAYREALEPLIANLRTDRFSYRSGEKIAIEAWICNDMIEVPKATVLRAMVKLDGKLLASFSHVADVPSCSSTYQGSISYIAPELVERGKLEVFLALCDSQGNILHDTSVVIDVYPSKITKRFSVAVLGAPNGKAYRLLEELGLDAVAWESDSRCEVIVVDDASLLSIHNQELQELVKTGSRMVVLDLEPGEYSLLGEAVSVKSSSMQPLHFVSRKTGHPMVAGFQPDDFRLWHSSDKGYIEPLLFHTLQASDMKPVLLSGNTDEAGNWGSALAVAEKHFGEGILLLCQVVLHGRCSTNPAAEEFALRLLGME